MSKSPKLDIKTTQSINMTANLQQSIKLLQLSAIELAEFIEQQLAINPLLYEKEELSDDEFDEEADEETDDSNIWTSLEKTSPAGSSKTNSDNNFSYDFVENNASPVSLKEFITKQLMLKILTPTQKEIAFLLIDLLDDDGYLKENLAELSINNNFIYDETLEVLEILQGLEPIGIFATSLQECLKIQLQEKKLLNPIFIELLNNLNLIATKKFEQLRKICNCDDYSLGEMLRILKKLNPKPATAYIINNSDCLIADIIVTSQKGNWLVELNNEILPKILIDNEYYNLIKKSAKSKNDLTYLSQQFSNGNWLIKSLDQRAKTLLKVASSIIWHQKDFLTKGKKYLKPMILKDIALELSIHESTVSRVVNNKYIATPQGIYELKYFFNNKLENDHNDHSSLTIKTIIAEIISKESISMSDQKIANLLKNDQNINIARRTVTKYREELRIAPAYLRKFEKL